MTKPVLYVLWGVCAGSFVAVAGPMLAWQYVCNKIDEAFASF